MLTDNVQDKQIQLYGFTIQPEEALGIRTLSCGRVQAGLSNRGMIMINTFINLKTNVV